MSFASRFLAIQEELARLCSHPVDIVGVTKRQPFERIREAVAGGISHLGNNYVQESSELMKQVFFQGKWHFIGHIQSRKAKELAVYDCVQSLDRLAIAQKLNEALVRQEKSIEVLVQVNIGREPQKSGIDPEDLEGFLKALIPFGALQVKGLMAMPPALEPVEARRPFFSQMKELFDRLNSNGQFDCLSMGTSEDYSLAVVEGATMIRLGSSLMGPRQ